MSKPAPQAPPASVKLYEALLATIPDIERKGATMPYTSVNGNMFSLLTSDGTLALRLPSPEREEFLKRYKSKLCVQHGVVLKEYVSVPAALLARTRELSKHLAVSYRYASELKAKATTRKKAAGKKTAKRPRRAK
jgi:TfoX/Sxy family transcriptional regulator of competence genes